MTPSLFGVSLIQHTLWHFVKGEVQLFDEVNLVEFESEDYPDERLIACRNPLIAAKNKKLYSQNFCR